jgi:hypothetical protein
MIDILYDECKLRKDLQFLGKVPQSTKATDAKPSAMSSLTAFPSPAAYSSRSQVEVRPHADTSDTARRRSSTTGRDMFSIRTNVSSMRTSRMEVFDFAYVEDVPARQ